MNRTLNTQTLQTMALFEKITKARLKDCFEDNFGVLTFVVDNGQVQKALGKNLQGLEKLKRAFNKRLRIVEFNPELAVFIKNVVRPVKVADVKVDKSDNIATITPIDSQTRGILIGRNAQNLRNSENIIKKYFELTELKVGRENEQEIKRNQHSDSTPDETRE